MHQGDTITAISSATGPAARMILRLSGPEAPTIAARFVDKPLSSGAWQVSVNLRGMTFPSWAYVFTAPRSYTREDLVELHIPGNPLLAKMLLEDLLRAGARSADPGEFTARAYFNGRLDLSEAEGVAATIAAGNEQELAAARRLLSGELARRLAPMLDAVAGALALLEVGIDFSDEDVTFLSQTDLAQRIMGVDASLGQLLDESVRFERLFHEPTVVLIGRPNAGKSTLLNALAGQDRAVVSPVAGTTRDVLSAQVTLSRGVVRLCDVAGVDVTSKPTPPLAASQRGNQDAGEIVEDRDTAHPTDKQHDAIAIDVIMQQMRQRALRAVEEADHVVLVRDVTDPLPPIALQRDADMTVWTKADLFAEQDQSGPSTTMPLAAVSAKTGENLDALRQSLDQLCFGETSTTSALALNARHVEAIHDARQALSRAIAQLSAGPEFIALELREALEALGRVGGAISPDDLLGRIFSAFCIGK